MRVEVYIRVQEIDHRGAQQMKDIHMPTQSMRGRGEQNGSGPVMEIDKSQEATSAGRNGLIWEACLPQLWSVLMSEAPVITEGSEDARSLGHRMVPQGHATAGITLILVACTATWGHGGIQAKAAAEGHVWVRGLTAVRVHVNIHGTCRHQGQWTCPGPGTPGAMLVSKDFPVARAMSI